ncbi:serine/threonine-protein kinase [Paraliomyxa miuraensis]|uniref:serine/threonine-protein kinase n=1 Tax=Paraliomyxa miuraensis TaxID=376150 RepID=UPI002253904E|nr:serine/threonine-protein kinase [Paraliomyxa miuraensis]MCX4241201.1 serine/threonine protein kinase [Paraliomyxa miuraensis]
MNEPALSLDALHTFSPAGQSLHEVGLETEPDEHEAERASNVDTLGAQDGVVAASLDDRLLHRDLKARIFGSDGRVTIGKYEVLRRIGRGGMGTVYVAHDPELDRKVALKVLRADRTRGRERMLQEARALAKLSHPNVVAVHEVGLHDDDRVFVAMEYVEGKTLRAWLEAGPARTALYDVFVQAARGLQAAHRAGLVHRDFKPENVLIGDDGRVRVVDFGVAKTSDSLDPEVRSDGAAGSAQADERTHQASLTLTGQLLGTPAYMAPEQFMGASVDARTDVFAFCVALYEALAGRRPFDGDDAASVSAAVLTGRPHALGASDVPSALATLIQQGLSREPAERPESLDALIRALESTRALVPAPVRAPKRRARAIVAGAMAAGLGAGLFVMSAGTTEHETTSAAAASGPMVWVSKDVVDERVLAGAAEATTEAEAEAFAAILAAADDDARLAAAEVFLERFGEHGSEVHRAVAHSAAGDVQWRRSCTDPRATHDLCIVEQPVAASDEPCSTPTRGRIERIERAHAQANAAQQNLRAATTLGGVAPPNDEQTRAAFVDAIARAQVQLADAELEGLLTLEVPAEIDFTQAKALSETAFKLFYTQLTTDGARLLQSYAAVKKMGDHRWTLVAAARSGMVSETASNALARTPAPAGLSAEQRTAYCGALDSFAAEPRNMARATYAYCVQKGAEHGLEGEPIVGFCRERLALYPEPK